MGVRPVKTVIEFIGIDIAKNKYDVCMGQGNVKQQYPNTAEGFKQFIKGLPSPEGCLIVMEEPRAVMKKRYLA